MTKAKATPQEEAVKAAEKAQAELAEARRLVMEEEQRKQQACMAELEVILRKYGYNLQTTPARIILMPTDQPPPP